MLQCLGSYLSRCCDLDFRQSGGLEDPEILARETVCMLLGHCCYHFLPWEYIE